MKTTEQQNKPINGNDLIALGYPENEILGIALKINKKRNGYTKAEMLDKYAQVLSSPQDFLEDKIFKTLAKGFIDGIHLPLQDENLIELNENPNDFKIYGAEKIEDGALEQMKVAMKLPVTVAGAIMPDAHQGYGLPIGGVLATKNAIIPYGVGVDIGCRMALSIYDLPASHYFEHHNSLKETLVKNTKFGAGHGFHGQYKAEHQILDDTKFETNSFIQNLKDKAWSQLGSSGGGNHFVEFGLIDFKEDDEKLNIKKGSYLALLTHSGSRGFGATIAGHYTKIAKEICKLPYKAQNLAYLDLDSAEGQEYWIAMNLAGEYASACHEIIHQKIAKSIGAEVLAKVENHHNFAWKEIYNGEEVIVHRKGATPASKDIMGIIPGSMTAPGFLVRGKGEENSINSASHGAGRQMSRTQAIKSLSQNKINDYLNDFGITLIGGGKDEAPMAYKDIHEVMAAQQDLVDIVATFTPKMVRMADDGSRED
ncbi:RtcB family protein [Empedobacter tilapiae]|uniref:3'-phosphate/5'-hydroxy nucleic acid ligase n=1 Tax=Empedobacter tilapiae TaxID=2491114 RepID=A0A4Z1BQT4_9FLAO|nr:RtcB family protein [Empedobacter tilapiae]TGN22991.1 RtcB family protein [Empedobacter tilapiae]